MNKNKLVLILIIILAFVLRFYKLNSYPALNADEAAIGYNAYSLIQTGRDEHGNPWPIHFQSFNDYKPGLYFYMVVPFVKVLGLNEWAVRIPGAMLGVLTVLLMYLLVKELFREGFTQIHKQMNADVLASIASLILEISPWHIHFSRGGWEVNVATFFMVLGLWLFLKGKGSLPLLMLSALSFVLSLYTYHAARVVVPLLLFGLLVIYRYEIRKNIKQIAITGTIAFLLLIPLGLDLIKGDVASRAAGVGLLSDPGPLARINEQRGEHENIRGLPALFLHNRPVNYGLAFLENWSDHYSGGFLFISGDVIQRNAVPETGQMYLFDILFIILGLIYFFRTYSLHTKPYYLILWWLLIAPTAAALTFQSPHALRSQNMVIPLTIITAFGFAYSLNRLSTVKLKWLGVTGFLVFGLLGIWSFSRYLNMYWYHMSKEYPYSSQYGIKELVTFVKENQDRYDNIVVTDRYDQPYILFLFYFKYPPARFQKEHNLTPRDAYEFSTVRSFDKYHFLSINWDRDRLTYPKSLIIGTDEEIPNEANIVQEIYGTNGYKYFQAVAN